jgi:hypothetical protein
VGLQRVSDCVFFFFFFFFFFFSFYVAPNTVKYFLDYFPEYTQTQEKNYFLLNHFHLQTFYDGK